MHDPRRTGKKINELFFDQLAFELVVFDCVDSKYRRFLAQIFSPQIYGPNWVITDYRQAKTEMFGPYLIWIGIGPYFDIDSIMSSMCHDKCDGI